MKFPKHECSLTLEHNPNKDLYQTVREYLTEMDYDFASEQARQVAIDTNELWVLRWYPETPIGFHLVAAPTLDEVLKLAEEQE